MSFVGSGTTGTEQAQKFLESLQNDFRQLSTETKKKNPQIKEVRNNFANRLVFHLKFSKCHQFKGWYVVSCIYHHKFLHFSAYLIVFDRFPLRLIRTQLMGSSVINYALLFSRDYNN